MTAVIKRGLIARISYSAPGAFLERVVRRAMPASLTIFMLHRLRPAHEGGPDRAALYKMLAFVRRHRYRVMDLEQAVNPATRLTAPTIAFTADDGYADQAELADLFADFEVPLTIFVVTGFLNRELWLWDDKIKYLFGATKRTMLRVECGTETREYRCQDVAARTAAMRDFRNLCKRVSEGEVDAALRSLAEAAEIDLPPAPPASFAALSWEDARRLERRGTRFGPHSHTHRILSRLSGDAEAANEIVRSWGVLRRQLSNPAPIFCYPTGRWVDFGLRETELLRAAGIRAAVAAEDGPVGRAQLAHTPYALCRTSLPASPQRFALNASSWMGAYRQIADLFERHGGKAAALRAWASRALVECGGYALYRGIEWSAVRRLVFVCSGNICRSPYAEARARALGLKACSFGLNGVDGAPAYPPAVDNAAVRGVSLRTHEGRSATTFKIEAGDLVLGMEPGHVRQCARHCRAVSAQVSLLGLWAPTPQLYIQDPYSRRDRYFQACFQLIDAALTNIAKHLQQHEATALLVDGRHNPD